MLPMEDFPSIRTENRGRGVWRDLQRPVKAVDP